MTHFMLGEGDEWGIIRCMSRLESALHNEL